MRPFFVVQDINYDSDNIYSYLDQTLGPIKKLLSSDDYSDISKEEMQKKLLALVEESIDDPKFATEAYQNKIWLQIEDTNQSLGIQYKLFSAYLSSLNDQNQRQSTIADYIIEMENRGELLWQEKAKNLLSKEIGY